jgi:hypothetical protein
MERKNNIDRRKALKQAGLLLGFAVSGPALTGVLNGCTAEAVPDWQPVFLSAEEVKLITAASDRIIPGAAEAGVPQFIDIMLSEYYLPEDQKQFQSGLVALEAQSQEILHKSFTKGHPAEQDQVLSDQAASAKKQVQADPNPSQPFFLMIKELTVLGFFTSEIGATQTLHYDEVPGGFQGCAPLESVGGKTWAT